ncbi:MAG: hypothetical protein JWO46_101, partial [Nocardioidaceae bacterium]|nr:hypothetical protein [Nocardioidaceae bacterium]
MNMKPLVLAVMVVATLPLTGCGSEPAASSKTPAPQVTVTATPTPTPQATVTATVTSEPTADEPAPEAGSDSFVMPDEVNKVLQTAQDDVQAASGNPFFYTDSTDATGAGRFQIL